MKPSLLLCALLAACGGKADDTSGTDGAAPLAVATWNVGLAYGFVPYSPERAPQVYEAVAALDADVVCLDEVWTQADIAAIQAAAASTFPYSAVEFTQEEGATGEPACTAEEAEPLRVCAEANCTGSDDLTSCVLSYCAEEFGALSDECTACAAANVGLNDVAAIIEVCTSGSGTMSWGGHNGLLLLSRQELVDPSYQSFDSWLVQRGVLGATVGGVEVTCTHIAAELSVPAYGGTVYGSYGEENAAQLSGALAFLEARPGERKVLLGDLNVGPAVGSLEGELADNWALTAGWSDPNVEGDAPFCTWCAENVLTGSSGDRAIDHVLVSGLSASSPSRISDAPITVSGADGEVSVFLSDHFGMRALVQ